MSSSPGARYSRGHGGLGSPLSNRLGSARLGSARLGWAGLGSAAPEACGGARPPHLARTPGFVCAASRAPQAPFASGRAPWGRGALVTVPPVPGARNRPRPRVLHTHPPSSSRRGARRSRSLGRTNGLSGEHRAYLKKSPPRGLIAPASGIFYDDNGKMCRLRLLWP